MKKNILYKRTRFPLSLVLSVFMSWMFFIFLFKQQNFIFSIIWSAVTALMTLGFLKLVGFFSIRGIQPRAREGFLLLFICPVPALILKYAFVVLTQVEVIRYHEILYLTPITALFAFFGQRIATYSFIKSGERFRISFLLKDSERQEVLQELNYYTRNHFDLFFSIVDISSEQKENIADWPDWIVFSRSQTRDFIHTPELLEAHIKGIPIIDWRELLTDLSGKIRLDLYDLWAFIISATSQTFLLRLYQNSKHIFEPLVAAFLMVVFFPLFVIIAILSGFSGPIFFKQIRTGYRNKPFTLIKFRTMIPDAEDQGPVWSAHKDPRVTKLGQFLRATHLDELPQLWNVLKGELNFIGPRPERPEFYEQLGKSIPGFHLRTLVHPGITGWAQVMYGYAGTAEESLQKLEYDLYYIQHMTPWLDMVILWNTVERMFSAKGTKNKETNENSRRC